MPALSCIQMSIPTQKKIVSVIISQFVQKQKHKKTTPPHKKGNRKKYKKKRRLIWRKTIENRHLYWASRIFMGGKCSLNKSGVKEIIFLE